MKSRRNTIQQALVLEAVRSLGSHATADDIFREASSHYANLSRATVYRVLKRLNEEGKIALIELSGAAEHYDHEVKPHYHLRCVKCGQIFDADMPYLGQLEQNIKDKQGFVILGYDLMFRCICPHCQHQIEEEKAQAEKPVDKPENSSAA